MQHTALHSFLPDDNELDLEDLPPGSTLEMCALLVRAPGEDGEACAGLAAMTDRSKHARPRHAMRAGS